MFMFFVLKYLYHIISNKTFMNVPLWVKVNHVYRSCSAAEIMSYPKTMFYCQLGRVVELAECGGHIEHCIWWSRFNLF